MAFQFQELKFDKVLVSTDWSPNERQAVQAILQQQIDAIDTEEKDLRVNVLYEAPCFSELAGQRDRLDQLLRFVTGMHPEFLEANRAYYEPYVVSTDEVNSKKPVEEIIAMRKIEQATESGPDYPDNLTERDIQLVIEQCKIQSATSIEQIEGFALAYSRAKQIALDKERLEQLGTSEIENFILEWGALIEKRNQKGFRQTPVTFQDGSRALDHSKIPQAIKGFCEGFKAFLEDPTEDQRLNTVLLYTEFERIHPLEDGNGRVGDLLWKVLETRKTGNWPEQLPPNVFGENRNINA